MKKGTLAIAVLLTSLISVSGTYLVLKSDQTTYPVVTTHPLATSTEVQEELEDCCRVSLFRETDDHTPLVHPLLFVEDSEESPSLSPLKNRLEAKIESLKSEGKITRASVYFKDQSSTRWTSAGGNDLYYPGSMLKVAMMIHILKLSESQPDILNALVRLDRLGGGEQSVPPSQRLRQGQVYKVSELIEAMITRSDNDATALLENFVQKNEYESLFMKLGLPVPAADDYYYQIRPSDYARFFRVLYNASYLNHENSSYALNLLTKSEFRDGLVAGLPGGAKAAHKFGERYTQSDLVQFHETGIVYKGSKAVLVCIMTEGKEFPALREALAGISKACFEDWK